MPDFLNKLNNRDAKPEMPEQDSGQEVGVTPEQRREFLDESREAEQAPDAQAQKEAREEPRVGSQSPTAAAAAKKSQTAAVAKSATQTQVESIMSSGLEEAYAKLDPQTKKIIKEDGEETAGAIANMLEHGKAVAKKILSLIRGWLHKIPGVNKYFLEQESKVKTDKIMALTKKEEEELYKQ